MSNIAVAGTGYVGLMAGVCLAEVGHQVTCVDIDAEKVALMQGGSSPIYEAGLEELMQEYDAAGRIGQPEPPFHRGPAGCGGGGAVCYRSSARG